jgi:hypothetical protein
LDFIEVPDLISKVLGDVKQLAIQPNIPPVEFPIGIDIISDDGSRFHTDQLIFKTQRAGVDQVVLSTAHHKLPLKLELTINRVSTQFNLGIHVKIHGNVHQIYQAICFWRCLLNCGLITFTDLNTGRPWFSVRTESLKLPGRPPDPEVILFIRNLDTIQRLTTTNITVSSGRINEEEMVHVEWLAELLTHGAHSSERLTLGVGVDRLSAERFLNQVAEQGGEPLCLCNGNHLEHFRSQTIPVGPVAIRFSSAVIPKDVLESMRKSLADPRCKVFNVKFTTSPGTKADCFLLNRLPKHVQIPSDLQAVIDQHNNRGK